jgi:hypothetical protein
VAKPKPDEGRAWWFNKPETAFGRSAILGIPQWVESLGSSRIRAYPSTNIERLTIDGTTVLRWYFAPEFITFFLSEDVEPAALSKLRYRLTNPDWKQKAKYGGPKFRVFNESDLQAVKDFVLDRLDIPEDRRPGESSRSGESRSPNRVTEPTPPPVAARIEASDSADFTEDEIELLYQRIFGR